MKLSSNFTLEELIASPTASRKNFTEQFTPSEEIIHNLKHLAVYILQPIRSLLGAPIRVSSGYRCARLNRSVGGSSTSQHVQGQAADVNNAKGSDIDIAKIVVNNNIDFDQMIIEFGTMEHPRWIHISHKITGNRKQILRAYKDGRRTRYKEVTIEDIRNA